MAADRGWQRDAECPFYHIEYLHLIECEGVIEGTLMRNYFKSTKRKYEYGEDFCAGNFRGCPLYQLLMEEYERRYQEGSL